MKRNNRGWLVGSTVGFIITTLVLLLLGVRLVFNPPTEACPAPALPVSTPVADFVWSSKGRLLVTARGSDLWIIDFPEQRATKLPVFPQPVSRIGWDRQGTPWLVYQEGLARLRPDHKGWDRFRVSPTPVVSPDGKWKAELTAVPAARRRSVFQRREVVVSPVGYSNDVVQRKFPSGNATRYAWLNNNILLVHRRGQWKPTPQQFRLEYGRLEELCPEPPLNKQGFQASYEDRTGPGEDLYEWLLQRQIPGFPWRRFRDRHLAVFDPAGRQSQRISAGRRHFSQGGNFWEAVKLSPDERFIVFRSADNALRVLDRGKK